MVGGSPMCCGPAASRPMCCHSRCAADPRTELSRGRGCRRRRAGRAHQRAPVGQTIRERSLDGRDDDQLGSVPHTVIGILPAGFQFPVGISTCGSRSRRMRPFSRRQSYACCSPLMGVARLRPGVTRAAGRRRVVGAERAIRTDRAAARGRRAGGPRAAQGRHRRTRGHDAVDAAGGGRLRAAHRLRERGDAADGAGDVAGARVCAALRAGCRTRPASFVSWSPRAWCSR